MLTYWVYIYIYIYHVIRYVNFAYIILFLNFVGQNLVVFRTDKGEVHVFDAYCPHLGANLGVGGIVKGDCIECPFHQWVFRGSDGECVNVPYSLNGNGKYLFFFVLYAYIFLLWWEKRTV